MPSLSIRVYTLCAVAAVALAGCGQVLTPAHVPAANQLYPKAYGDTIIEGALSDPAILNPVLASDSASAEVADLIFDSLLQYDKNLNLVGRLAESWEVSPDSLVMTFRLKKGVKWHDGHPLTARDVKFTLDTYLNKNVRTAYRSNYENIARSEAVDDLTFRVWYREPFAPALERLGGMSIIPEHLLKGRDVNVADDFNTRPVGSGPYKFNTWKRLESVALEANPEYVDGRTYLNRVIFRVIPDMGVQFLELQNGGIDTMSLTPDQYKGEGNASQFTAAFNKYRYPSNQYTYMGFNLRSPLFQDRGFREAIVMAIDRQALVNSVLQGLGQVSTGPFTPSSWAYNPDVKPIPYDPLRARELFVAAGCRYSPTGQLTRNGQPVTFTLLTNQGNRNREQAATIIQAQLKEVGIAVNLRNIAWSTFLNDFVNKRKFDAVLLGWSLSQDPDLYDIWHSSKTGEHEMNVVSYKNPDVDRLLVQGRKTFSRDKRAKIYHEIHRLVAADIPYAFLYVSDSLPVVHKRFLGIEPGPAGIGYNFIKWYVPQQYQKYAQ